MSNFTDYIEISFTSVNEEMAEILLAELSDLPFESFDIDNNTLKAYISILKWEEDFQSVINEIASSYSVNFTKNTIKGENWNAVWESSFQPVEIAGKVRIRADFHSKNNDFPYEITINPKMAFGTGHHFTTKLMMENMFEVDFKNKRVLDMGCGTGILAILAYQLGANSIVAIDNDPQCIESVLENKMLNEASIIETQIVDETLPTFQQPFDIIIANIQRNVLLDQMQWYEEVIKPKGVLFLSGIYTQDISAITEKAINCGFDSNFTYKEENNWVSIKMTKL